MAHKLQDTRYRPKVVKSIVKYKRDRTLINEYEGEL